MSYFFGNEQKTVVDYRIDFEETQEHEKIEPAETYDRRDVGPDEVTTRFRCPKF